MVSRIKSLLKRLIPARVWGRLHSWRVRRLIRQFPKRDETHTYAGWRLTVRVSDPLAESWYGQDWPELPEVTYLRASKLRPGARVFDAGAHQGVVALVLSRIVRPGGHVVAIEASRHNAEIATWNRNANDAPELEILNAAVADKPGVLQLSEDLNCLLSNRGHDSVTAVTLDDLAVRYGKPDVVFLDVEGAEAVALQGARSILATDADFFVECHVGCGLEALGGSVSEILQHFPPERYDRAVGNQSTGFRPLDGNDPLLRERFYLIATVRQPA